MANFGFYRDECVTQTFRDYDSIGAIVDACSLLSKAKMLLVVDRHKMRNGDKPAKNIRCRWQIVSADDNQRYCRTFRSLEAAKRHVDQLVWRRGQRPIPRFAQG